MQHKLNALADGLADLMDYLAENQDRDLHQDLVELRAAVGLETRESTSGNDERSRPSANPKPGDG